MKEGEGVEEGGDKAAIREFKRGGVRPRHFKQTTVASKKQEAQPEQVKRVLARCFKRLNAMGEHSEKVMKHSSDSAMAKE
jgi:hypothetical protein